MNVQETLKIKVQEVLEMSLEILEMLIIEQIEKDVNLLLIS